MYACEDHQAITKGREGETQEGRAPLLLVNGFPRSANDTIGLADWILDVQMGYRCWYCGKLSPEGEAHKQAEPQFVKSIDEPAMPQWFSIESSRMNAVRYPPEGGWIHVRFTNGTAYQYDAPLSAINEFMMAESKGRALKILEGYPYRKIDV